MHWNRIEVEHEQKDKSHQDQTQDHAASKFILSFSLDLDLYGDIQTISPLYITMIQSVNSFIPYKLGPTLMCQETYLSGHIGSHYHPRILLRVWRTFQTMNF